MTSDRGSSGGAELELTPVTPKSPGLNPNASVFSCKLSTPEDADTGQWDQQNDSGIANNSTSDLSFVNGDISGDKSDIGVFSPTSESPFQGEYAAFTDNQVYSDNNANVAGQLEEGLGSSMLLDNQQGVSTFSAPDTQSTFTANSDASQDVPMTGIQFTSETAEGEVLDGNLSDDQLRQVLKHQLETYFSRENLSGDSYLQSQMDADQYVPIATVSSLDQIQRLTNDIELIVELLRESNFVQVDEKGEKVRPNHNRCIVILREIPDTTPVQEVQELFAGPKCPKFVSCEFAHNSNWYVTFDSDADAQRAYQYLREEVRTFLGKPIMARIKAKPLIRTYRPQNGYIHKRFQQQPPVSQPQISPAGDVPVSAAQQQFTATQQPFTLMQNVSQYHISGQQAIPFYPPPPNLLQTWPTAGGPMLDPGMVLAMNGYQATKVNQAVPNRNPFTNVNRSSNRNQKMPGNQPMHRDRINSNESLPPRLQHQQDRHHNSINNNIHKTSPRNQDSAPPISNHAPSYQGRRMDGPGGHGGHHGNHSHGNHGSHMGHSSQSHYQQHQHLDHNANSHGGGMNSRMSQDPMSQKYPGGKSYRSRRRRDEDGANRPSTRSNSSQSSQKEGGVSSLSTRQPTDKFDYEPTSFPPLPGSMSNRSSGEEKFESKLSDVVKGTAKLQVKEGAVATTTNKTVSTSTQPSTPATSSLPTNTTTSKPATPQATVAAVTTRDQREGRDVTPSTAPPSQSGAVSATPQRDSAAAASKPPTGTPPVQQPVSSSIVRSTSKPAESAVPDGAPSDSRTSSHSQSNTDDRTASVSAASSVKLSYAQMVQRSKAAEASASALAEKSDSSDSDGADPPQTNRANHTLKEQGQQPAQSTSGRPATVRAGGKDFTRKDSRDGSEYRENNSDQRRSADMDFKRDTDYRKENDYRRDEPKEQRCNHGRRMKENRERRFGERDRDMGRRPDRRDRDGPARDGARMTAIAK